MNTKTRSLASVLMLIAAFTTMAFGQTKDAERSVRLSIDINAPVEKVWSQWTTTEGITKFFAPATEFDLKPMGRFNILFQPNAPAGSRGAEGNMILTVQEKSLLSFTGDAPPQWPEIRKQRTFVAVRFEKIDANSTRVILTHSGFGTGGDWDAVVKYFETAWGGTVLPFLKYSLETGPVDWSDFPKRLPKGLKPATSQTAR